MTLAVYSYTLLLAVCLLLVMKPTNGSLGEAGCDHNNRDYMWNNVREVTLLDGSISGGMLVLSTGGTINVHCVADLDPEKLVTHIASDNSLTNKACIGLKYALEKNRLLVENKVRDVRFIIGFEQRIWYSDMYGIHDFNLSHADGLLNMNFAMPNIERWVKRYLSSMSGSIMALALVQTTNKSPSYPSAIFALDDPQLSRVLAYQPVDPFKVPDDDRPIDHNSNEYHYKPGYFPFPIEAMALTELHHADLMTAIIFFDKYYARMRINTTRQWARQHWKEQLKAFPILPAQGAIGCPVHLCWWPVMDTMFYHEGVYYIVQGRWLFAFVAGHPNSTLLYADKAFDLEDANIHFRIYALYYDYNLRSTMLVLQKNRQHFIESVELRRKANGEIQVLYDGYTEPPAVFETRNIEVVESVTMVQGDARLWVAYSWRGKVSLQTYQLHNESGTPTYRFHMEIADFAYPGLSAFFYHPGYGHLFIVTGFFLYIYQSADLAALHSSNCSVVEFNFFFNCSAYYNMERMDESHRMFTSRKQYSEDAQRFHEGSEWLPGACNFYEEIPFDRIPFEPKRNVTEPAKPWKIILFASVAGLMAVLGTLAVAGCCFSGGKKNQGRSSDRRRSQERKLKQYLQNFKKSKSSNSTLSTMSSSTPSMFRESRANSTSTIRTKSKMPKSKQSSKILKMIKSKGPQSDKSGLKKEKVPSKQGSTASPDLRPGKVKSPGPTSPL